MQYETSEFEASGVVYVLTIGIINGVTRYECVFRKHDNVLMQEYYFDENKKLHGTTTIRYLQHVSRSVRKTYDLPQNENTDIIETVEYNHGNVITNNAVNAM